MKKILKIISVLMVLVIVWEITSRHVNNLFVATPRSVVIGIINLQLTGQLLNSALYSLGRVLLASVLASIVSILIGITVYAVTPIRDFIYPIIKSLRFIPITAFYPLLIMWCGIGEYMKITFLFIVTFITMLPSVVLSLSDVNPDMIDTGKTIGMDKFQILYRIVIPYTVPNILQTFALLLSIGWTYIPYVETINAKYGLGYIVYQSSSRGRTDLVFSAVIVIIALSVMIDIILNKLIRRMFKWKRF